MCSFCTAKATYIFFSKKLQHICVSLDVSFNVSLTNDAISFEQLVPGGIVGIVITNTKFSGSVHFLETTGTTLLLIRCLLYPHHFHWGVGGGGGVGGAYYNNITSVHTYVSPSICLYVPSIRPICTYEKWFPFDIFWIQILHTGM